MQHVPVVTVITDLGKVHESWLVPEADAVVVPAREVYARALSRGVPPSRLRLLGHPIHPKFDDVTGSKADLRAALGLPADDTPIVMLMAGGEGGGKLLSTALALGACATADRTRRRMRAERTVANRNFANFPRYASDADARARFHR